MKITDKELDIKSILDVHRGCIPQGKRECRSRHSDCFVLVCTGSADYCFNGEKHTASQGDLIFLSHRSTYTIDISCNNYTFIYVDFFFGADHGETLSNMIYKSERLSGLEQYFEQLYNSKKVGSYADDLYCRALLYLIYTQAARSDITQYISKKRRNDLDAITQYMQSNLSDTEMSVKKLALACGISEVHFRRLFEKIYHTSPSKYLNALRIRRAKELLTEKSYSMAQISEKCGFRNQYYFSKAFKALTTLTPSEYKSRYSQLI